MIRLFVIFAVLSWSSLAVAQDSVLLLVSHVDETGSTEPTYWWAEPNSQFSEADEALFRGLDHDSIAVLRPDTTDQVSRIFRRPDLTDSNASNLAGVLGATYVWVGQITLAPEATLGAGAIVQAEATVDARLLRRTSGGRVEVLDAAKWTINGFEQSWDEATRRVHEQVGVRMREALRLFQVAQQSSLDVPLTGAALVLRGVQNGKLLEQTLSRLERTSGVSTARVIWVSANRVGVDLHKDGEQLTSVAAVADALNRNPETPVRLNRLESGDYSIESVEER